MSSPPKPEDDQSHPTHDMHAGSPTPPAIEAQPATQQPTQGAANPPEHTQQIVGLCNTAIRQALLKIKNCMVFIDCHNAFITAVATIAIAILTYNYVTYAKRQWIAMRDQSAQTEKAFIASQRAWLGVNEAKLDEAPVAGKKVSISIPYHNTGRDPARNVNGFVEKSIIPAEEEVNGILEEKAKAFVKQCLGLQEREAGAIIYPSIGVSIASVSPLDRDEAIDENVVTGKKLLIIQGCAGYRTLDLVKHAAFCFLYKGGRTHLEHLEVCPSGFYTD